VFKERWVMGAQRVILGVFGSLNLLMIGSYFITKGFKIIQRK
jgi:hypothetical protein